MKRVVDACLFCGEDVKTPIFIAEGPKSPISFAGD
jgi:hypothetical protein